MAFIDYYKILGISKDTPQKDIQSAYRKRAKQFHPDLHPDDPKAEAKFKALSEAYQVLSDPEKRSKYDRYGEHWEQADRFGGYDPGSSDGFNGGFGGGGDFDFSQFAGGGNFSSFFRDLFGGGTNFGGQSSNVNPASYDIEAKVTIDLYTAMLGGDILLRTQGGKLKLKVKPETQPGTKMRLRGKGNQKPDGTYGNLIITFEVKLPTGLNDRQKSLLQAMRDA